jgi:predicted transposase YbfD/YdcC
MTSRLKEVEGDGLFDWLNGNKMTKSSIRKYHQEQAKKRAETQKKVMEEKRNKILEEKKKIIKINPRQIVVKPYQPNVEDSEEEEAEEEEGGALLQNPITRIKNYVNLGKTLFSGRDNFQPSAREVLTKYGNDPIVRIYLVRNKLSAITTGVLNALSFGKFMENNHEEGKALYHLAMLVETNRANILVEKKETWYIYVNPRNLSPERMEVPLNGQTLSLNQLLYNAERRAGKNFWSYSASEKNCQEAIRNILYANNLNTPENIAFSNQDTQHLFKDSPNLKALSDGVTGFAEKLNILNEGVGLKHVHKYRILKKKMIM